MSKGLSGAGWLSDCPCSQSIASGLNPSLDVFEAMLFCCLLYYGKKHTKWKHRLPHAQRGNKKGTSVPLNGVPKTGNLGGSSLGSDLN